MSTPIDDGNETVRFAVTLYGVEWAFLYGVVERAEAAARRPGIMNDPKTVAKAFRTIKQAILLGRETEP